MATGTTSKAATCSLTLKIGHQSYAVRRLRADAREFGVTRAYRLRRLDGRDIYTVTETADGHACDCADAVFRHEEGDARCKHVRSLRAWGLL